MYIHIIYISIYIIHIYHYVYICISIILCNMYIPRTIVRLLIIIGYVIVLAQELANKGRGGRNNVYSP